MKPNLDPTVWPETLTGPRGSPVDKKKIMIHSKQRIQILSQRFCTRWDENILMGSWSIKISSLNVQLEKTEDCI